MKRLSLLTIIALSVTLVISSCGQPKGPEGYEWLGGEWEGELIGSNGKPMEYAELVVKKNKFSLKRVPENGGDEKFKTLKIGKVFNPMLQMVVLALDESGMIYINEEQMNPVLVTSEFGSIELYRKGEGAPQRQTAPAEAVSDPAVRLVYSSAYDGFVNIRATASSRGQVLGELRNGPDGAEFLGAEGSWTKINYHGIVGYVYSKYICDTPAEAVNPIVTADWLEGIWRANGGYVLLVFNNGKFEFGYDYGTTGGKYTLQGNTIKFIPTWIHEGHSGFSETLVIDVNADMIGYFHRMPYSTPEELEECGGYGIMTKSDFRKAGRSVGHMR